jgi:hypothetical protein
MKFWKPSRIGRYLFKSRVVEVGTVNGIACEWKSFSGVNVPLQDGPWSMFEPEWQQGAPTVEQLERWQWWYLKYSNNEATVERVTVNDCAEGGFFWDSDVVASAPVQPDMSNGPLWVPLEVANAAN